MSDSASPSSSAPPSFSKPLVLPLSESDLALINAHLRTLSPSEILQWALEHLPRLHQTTAFGLTGLAAIDMLSKLTSSPPPLIFVDTLYHFKETLDLVTAVESRYGHNVVVYKPEGCETVQDFEKRYGERLWETDDESYDYHVKVEPARRAYADLNVLSVITGRRASQGFARATLQPLEVDSTGLVKLNPFFAWSFAQVNAYIKENNVPRNALLDQGYRSVGDWHSTQKSILSGPANGNGFINVVNVGLNGDEAERAGRWAGRKEKTECGLHTDYFAMRAKMLKKQREEESAKAATSVESVPTKSDKQASLSQTKVEVVEVSPTIEATA